MCHTKIKDSSFLESGCPVITKTFTFSEGLTHTLLQSLSDRVAKISKSQTDGQHTAISLSQSAPITYLQHILQQETRMNWLTTLCFLGTFPNKSVEFSQINHS